jgi:HK97 family phage portal protein
MPEKKRGLAIRAKAVASFAVQQVFSSLWGGVGPQARETFAGAWQSSDRYAGNGVVRKSPLAHSAVFTCINNITSDCSKLPLDVMRPRANGGGKEKHMAHPLWRVLRKPNHYQTSLQFLQQYFGSKLWTGNTYVLLFRDARGVTESMHVIDPATVTPAITADGSVWYHVKANVLNGLPEDVYIPARDVLHDRAVTLFHPLIGVSPLYASAVSAMIGNSILSNSDMFFSNMSRASGTLTSPGEIPEPVATRLKREWDGNYTGMGYGKVAVLGSGLTWTPLTMTAVDAQLIEQLRWVVEDIGRVYRVPGFMLGETKITYKNTEQLSRLYFNGCLSYHLESAEQCFNQKFEMSGGSEIRFDLAPLFRMETDLRYETHSKALTSGIKSINEVRAEEDLEPVTGGEEPRLQMQYIPLSKVDAVLAANSAAPPAPAPPAPAPPAPAPPAQEDDEPEEASAELVAGVLNRLKAASKPEMLGA